MTRHNELAGGRLADELELEICRREYNGAGQRVADCQRALDAAYKDRICCRSTRLRTGTPKRWLTPSV